jgi:hypothetical protein
LISTELEKNQGAIMVQEQHIQDLNMLGIDIKLEHVVFCVKQIFKGYDIEIASWRCTDIDYKTPNFTTAGLYRLHGLAYVEGENMPWSIVVKIIKPDSSEKDDPRHHSYWKREALVFRSNVLSDLPKSLHSVDCYLIEDRADGTIGLWMENIDGENDNLWSQEDYCFIAQQLGLSNGAYLMGRSLPSESWICQNWLTSWVASSRMYAPNPYDYIHLINNDIDQIWKSYQIFNKHVDSMLKSLVHMPRVLAHQDLSQKNMFLHKTNSKNDQLILIDWQFMSISGIGEDLGKLFGVNMSTNNIPQHKYEDYKNSIFEYYLQGLRETGWQGDERIARYGYCTSVAMRCVWEVPQFIYQAAKLVEEPDNIILQERVSQLEKIIFIQMEMAKEAEDLKEYIKK